MRPHAPAGDGAFYSTSLKYDVNGQQNRLFLLLRISVEAGTVIPVIKKERILTRHQSIVYITFDAFVSI